MDVFSVDIQKIRESIEQRSAWKSHGYKPWSEDRRVAASIASKCKRAGLIVPTLKVDHKKQRAIINAAIAAGGVWDDSEFGVIYSGLKKKKIKVIKIREPKIVLSYPYIIKPRDEHAELLTVNKLVPPMPGREDICQEIMLALWERKITMDQLRANLADVRSFVRSFKRANYEVGGYAVSLDQPMESGQSWHDVLPDPATLDYH